MNPMTHTDSVNDIRYNYEYDGIGRLIRQELRSSDNSTHLGATEFTYDLRNNVTKIANEIGGRTLGQWYYYTSINGVTGSIRAAKENLPVRYSMSSNRHVTYSYDSINRLTQKTLSTDTPLISTYAYKASERDTNTYTTTQISTEHSGKFAYDYTYDVAGNITSVKKADSNGSGSTSTAWSDYRAYTYDDFSQLTSETNATTGKTYTYTYDNVGNITSKSDGTSTITYTYGTDSDAGWSKLLTSYNGETIDYDAIGNPTTYRGASLTWNGRQLNSYTEGDTTITYTYDADGLRGSKTVNGTKTTYQYLDGKLYYQETNGDDIYFHYDSYGTITAISAYLATGNWGYVFVGTNSLGDVNALYNPDGELLVKYEYDAWGNVIAETDANGNPLTTGPAKNWSERNPFRYRGYVYDAETGLYYLQSRYYDPEVGRFLNSDAIANATDSLGFNTYAYCGNNPVNYVDPTGYVANFVNSFSSKMKDAWIKGYNYVYQAESYAYISGIDYDVYEDMYDDYPRYDRSVNSDRQKSVRKQINDAWGKDKNNREDNSNDHHKYKKKTGRGGNNNLPFSDLVNGDYVEEAVMIGSGVAIVWILLNDLTGVGVADDAALIPAISAFAGSMGVAYG